VLRLYVIVVIKVLALELLLGLAFWAGYVWAGGVFPGLLLALAVLALLLLPWFGDLRIEFDSARRELLADVSWWGHAQIQFADVPELRVRVLGIPYRRRMTKKTPPAKREEERKQMQGPGKRGPTAGVGQDPQRASRLGLAGLQALNELVWATRELILTVNAPSQIDAVDEIIAGFIGHRLLGLVEVVVLPEGPRRVHVVYRAPLLRVVAAAAIPLIMGTGRRRRKPR
jgi:hypothetical protein